MRRPARFGALVILLVAAGCARPSTSPDPGIAIPESAMPVLAASAVPGIPAKTTTLTTAVLAQDASIPGLASMIASWGYLGGRQRTFQGESPHLTLVVSRSLLFANTAGAQDFATYVRDHAADFFGIGAQTQPLVAQGRAGWQFTPPPCACHLANPAYVGVLADGSLVVWLEINGPDATPALLAQLLVSVRGASATPPG